MTLNDRVRDVLRGSPEVQALLDELAAARTAVIEISAKLATLPSDVAPNWHAEKPRVVPQTDAEWKGCIEELRSNADASLPS